MLMALSIQKTRNTTRILRQYRSVGPLALAVLALTAFTWTSAGQAAEDPPADDRHIETATFSMYCYWTGEATLGRADGVLASRIGHWGGKEIVQVDYDATRTDLRELISRLEAQRSFYSVLAPSDGTAESIRALAGGKPVSALVGEPDFIEPKHSLRTRHPNIAKLDLTEAQAIALNSWSYFGGPMPDVLTPEQKRKAQKNK